MAEDIENNPTVRKLLHELEQLKARVTAAETKQREYLSPFGRVLLVKRGAEDAEGNPLAWKEQTVVGGSVVDFVDGRECAEDDADAALLTSGGAELVLEFEDEGTHRYVPLTNDTLVFISGLATGVGKYTGQVVLAPAAIDPETDLVYTEFGADGEEILILNLDDMGQTAHGLLAANDKFYRATFINQPDTTGRRVAVIHWFNDYSCVEAP